METWRSERPLAVSHLIVLSLSIMGKTVQMSTDNKRTTYQNVYHVQHNTERDSPKLAMIGRTFYRKDAAATQPGARYILLDMSPPAPPCT